MSNYGPKIGFTAYKAQGLGGKAYFHNNFTPGTQFRAPNYQKMLRGLRGKGPQTLHPKPPGSPPYSLKPKPYRGSRGSESGSESNRKYIKLGSGFGVQGTLNLPAPEEAKGNVRN